MTKNAQVLKIKLVKSLIGRLPKHIAIAKQLGLTKMNKTVTHKNTPAIQGLVNQIYYMVEVQDSAK